jgi:Zn-dependent peptidase ImmA (M78 family)
MTQSQGHRWLDVKLRRLTSYDILTELVQTGVIPVDVTGICRQLDIEVQTVESPGYDGALSSDWTRAVMWIDSTKTLQCQRFTIAHLLGHLMIHTIGETYRTISASSLYGMGDIRLESTDGSRSASEIAHALLGRQASEFGAALLMPRFKVQPLVYHSMMNIEEMADVFCVPVTAMGGRLTHIRSGREDR